MRAYEIIKEFFGMTSADQNQTVDPAFVAKVKAAKPVTSEMKAEDAKARLRRLMGKNG